MMQEEELVIKDEHTSKRYGNSENSYLNSGQDVLPFTISDGVMDDEPSKKYVITLFEIFVTLIIMLNTISGGYMEGYTSPALASLLIPSNVSTSVSIGSLLNEPTLDRNPSLVQDSSSNSTNTSLTIQNHLNSSRDDTRLKTQISNDKDNLSQESSNVQSDKGSMEIIEDSSLNSTESTDINEFTTLIESSLTEELCNNSNDGNCVNETNNLITTLMPEVLPSPSPLKSSKEETQVQSSLQITEEEGSWMGSLLLLGAALGSGISPYLIRLGRRHAIIMSAVPRVLGWILISLSTSVYTFYIGRLLCGISIGAVSPACSIYISEVAHPSLRGSLSCLMYLGVNVGIFTASLLGTFLEWQGLAIFGCITVASYFFPSFFIPNSPAWLVLGGRESDARTSLRRLRRKNYSVEDELQQIISIAEKEFGKKSVTWKELLTQRRTVLPLSVVLLLTFVNRFSGYNAVISYCSVFLRDAAPSVSEYWAAVAVCLVQIVASVGAMTLVDSWGRRKLLLLSVISMGLSLLVIVAYESSVLINSAGTWIAVLGTMTYVGAYSLGIGPLTWVLMGELFPLDAREKASAVISMCNWGLAFIVTKTYFSLESSVGIAGTCVLYASVCLLGSISMFFLVPETKGRSLAEIEAHLSYTQKVWFPTVRKFDQALSSILDQDAAVIDTYSTFH